MAFRQQRRDLPPPRAAKIIPLLSLALFFYLHLFFASELSSAATITLSNRCSYTVWPGILSNAGWEMLANGGFELPTGESASLTAPPGWSGRFWGRTGCKFGTASTASTVACATGDCAGRLQCAGAGATTPATLAEISVGSGGSRDFYDVSLVDGYNLPLAVVPTGGAAACEAAICAANINLVCPAALQVVDMVKEEAASVGVASSAATVVGCRSACDAFRSPQFCCSGAYSSPATCSPSSYAHIFKSACPSAYSYAFDDPTSTFTCSSADYTIVFCPSSSSQKSVRGMEQPDLVGTQAYASETSTSASLVCPPGLLVLVIVHAVLMIVQGNY